MSEDADVLADAEAFLETLSNLSISDDDIIDNSNDNIKDTNNDINKNSNNNSTNNNENNDMIFDDDGFDFDDDIPDQNNGSIQARDSQENIHDKQKSRDSDPMTLQSKKSQKVTINDDDDDDSIIQFSDDESINNDTKGNNNETNNNNDNNNDNTSSPNKQIIMNKDNNITGNILKKSNETNNIDDDSETIGSLNVEPARSIRPAQSIVDNVSVLTEDKEEQQILPLIFSNNNMRLSIKEESPGQLDFDNETPTLPPSRVNLKVPTSKIKKFTNNNNNNGIKKQIMVTKKGSRVRSNSDELIMDSNEDYNDNVSTIVEPSKSSYQLYPPSESSRYTENLSKITEPSNNNIHYSIVDPDPNDNNLNTEAEVCIFIINICYIY